MSNPVAAASRPLPQAAIIVIGLLVAAALAWLAIADLWTAFIIVAVIGGPPCSVLWTIRSRQLKDAPRP